MHMDVLITIDGREAIPIRAIPLLTDWQVLSPDAIAKALAGDELWFPQFIALTAYQIQDGTCKAIPAKFWDRLLMPKIEALSARIKQEAPDGIGRARWLHESLCVLPAFAFVWRDEFEDCFWRKYGPNGEVSRDVELDLSPFIPELEKQKLVMEGFEAYQEVRRQVRVEYATSWDNWGKIDDYKDQIAQWEKQEQTTGLTPSKAHTLMVLRQELKQLMALVAPAGTVGQPAPLHPELPPSLSVPSSINDAPTDGITTAQVATAFDGILFSAEQWPKRLSEAKWPKSAQVTLGVAGGASSLWNPLKLARLIYDRSREDKKKNLATLNARFNRQDVLAHWRNDWSEFYAMFNDADDC